MSLQTDRTDDRRWVSLGMEFGGHTKERPWSFAAPSPDEQLPPRHDLAGQADSAEWEMKKAGFELEENYPGSPVQRCAVRCVVCGTPQKVSLQSVRRGARCRRRHEASPR